MNERILGIDVSWWQGLWDWKYCAEETPVKFAFIRAGSIDNTSGVCYEDRLFRENADEAPNYLPVGFYWYFRPNHDPIKQAEFFAELIYPELWLLPPAGDHEENGGLSPSEYADSIHAFDERLETLLGYKRLKYTSKGKWADVESRLYWQDSDLWVAHWTTAQEPLLPIDWDYWRFWQWSNKGMAELYGGLGTSTYVDLDYFNGTLEDLHEYIGIPTTPEYVIVTAKNNAVIRAGPREGKQIRIEPEDSIQGVLGEAKDEQGVTWYDLGTGWIRSDLCAPITG